MTPELILIAINSGIQLIDMAIKVGQDLQQKGEMTEAEEAAFLAKIEGLKDQPWWTPDAE